jgi:Flp pilus assembly protein, protease CpaA
MTAAAIFVIFPLCMAIAAFTDMLSMTIPNRVSVILGLSFLVVAPLAGMGLIEIGWHLAAGAIVLAAGFALFALNIMGGGDAKVLAASALWYGYNSDLVLYLGTVGVLGGFLALIVLALRANQNTLLALPVPIPMHFFKDRVGIPYGMAIGLAAFLTYPDTDIVARAMESLH